MHDHEADDEESYADEDLEAAFLRLEANLPRRGEKKHERERVEAEHEPVRLRLRQGEEKCECATVARTAEDGEMIATGIAAATPSAVPIAFPRIRSRFPMRM